MSASERVLSFQKCSKVLNFLGMAEDSKVTDIGKLKFMNRTKQVPVHIIYDDPVLGVQVLQAVLLSGGNPSTIEREDFIVKQYKALSTSVGTIARLENFTVYTDDDGNDKIGCISNLFEIKWRGKCHQIVSLKKVRPEISDHSYQKIRVLPDLEIVKVRDIEEPVHVIHDCKVGGCKVKTGPIQKKVEQELHTVEDTYLKHSFSHNVYFINK